MKYAHYNATEHSRLMEVAKARAHQLRTQAVTHFWNEAGLASRRALKVAIRLVHTRVRPAPACRPGV